MANAKISALTSATTPLAGTETLPVVQSSTTKQVSVANLTAGRAVSASSLTATSGGVSVKGGPTGYGGDEIAMTSNTSTFCAISTQITGASLYFDHRGTSNTADWAWRNGTGAATTRMQLTSVGNLLLNTGNLVPSTAARGVNFTANTPAAGMTSQLLNWYEEGAFTPTLTFGGLSVGVTYGGGTVGKYTRIGRMVFANTHIVLTSKGSSTGTANIASMPFAASVNTAVAFGYVSGMGATISYLEGYISGSAIILFKLVAGSSSLVTDADFTNATNIQLTIGYEVS
jgi:hypothetical protein